MIKDWQKFEKDSFEYIKNNFSNENLTLKLLGDSDSSKSDIYVKTPNSEFFIEIKSPISQGGQFVLSKNNQKKWIFGEGNKTKNTINSSKIIDDLNSESNFNITTASTNLTTDSETLSNWLIDFYSQKNVRYIITKFNSEYVILPLNKISTYFNIIASVRKKGSGSSDVSNPFWNKIKNFEIFKNVTESKVIGKKRYLYFKVLPNQFNENSKIVFSDFINDDFIRLQLEVVDTSSNKVYIRKLSTTSNPTVIFTLESKTQQQIDDLNDFKQSLI